MVAYIVNKYKIIFSKTILCQFPTHMRVLKQCFPFNLHKLLKSRGKLKFKYKSYYRSSSHEGPIHEKKGNAMDSVSVIQHFPSKTSVVSHRASSAGDAHSRW